MARRNYQVDGLSGTGKSSVYEELIRRGYLAVSTDRAWKVVTGSSRLALWDEDRAVAELERPEPEVLFVCGSSGDRERYLPYFAGVFTLRVDDDTMRRRLRERTNNDYGKQPEELELMLGLNRAAAPSGPVEVDATRPLEQVVADVLRLAGCPAIARASPLAAWARREDEHVHAFAIPASMLPISAGVDVDAVRRSSLSRLDFAWSGDVLAAVLGQLADQGIEFARSSGSIVLTPEDRERYLARLDPSAFDGAVLRRRYEQATGTAAPGVEYALLDGIAFVRDTLALLGPETLAVLVGA